MKVEILDCYWAHHSFRRFWYEAEWSRQESVWTVEANRVQLNQTYNKTITFVSSSPSQWLHLWFCTDKDIKIFEVTLQSVFLLTFRTVACIAFLQRTTPQKKHLIRAQRYCRKNTSQFTSFKESKNLLRHLYSTHIPSGCYKQTETGAEG